jgi:hypothetical protein
MPSGLYSNSIFLESNSSQVNCIFDDDNRGGSYDRAPGTFSLAFSGFGVRLQIWFCRNPSGIVPISGGMPICAFKERVSTPEGTVPVGETEDGTALSISIDPFCGNPSGIVPRSEGLPICAFKERVFKPEGTVPVRETEGGTALSISIDMFSYISILCFRWQFHLFFIEFSVLLGNIKQKQESVSAHIPTQKHKCTKKAADAHSPSW